MTWKRSYHVVRIPNGTGVNSGDAIGLVQLVRPANDVTTIEFGLRNPGNEGNDREFIELSHNEIERAEFETHRDAVETLAEFDIIDRWYCNGTLSMHILVEKKKPADA